MELLFVLAGVACIVFVIVKTVSKYRAFKKRRDEFLGDMTADKLLKKWEERQKDQND